MGDSERIENLLQGYLEFIQLRIKLQLKRRPTSNLLASPEDLVQETFARLLAKPPDFNNPGILGFINRRIHFTISDIERRYRKEQSILRKVLVSYQEEEESKLELEEYLSCLDPVERKLFVGFYLLDTPILELAELMSTTKSRIYRKLHQIREKIRTHLRGKRDVH